jgi:hypothetical protein
MSRRRRILLIVAIVLIVPAAVVGITAAVAPQVLMSLVMPPPPAPDPPLPPVKYNAETTEVGMFLDHPIARKLLDKHFPGFRNDEQVGLTRRLTLPEVQRFYPDLITDEALSALKAELDPMAPLQPVVVYSTSETELGTLLDDPEAVAIIDKHIPDFSTGDGIEMTRPFTIAFIQPYVPDRITDERRAAIDAEFAALADARADASAESGAGK